jgi:signal transduction histidine kinase
MRNSLRFRLAAIGSALVALALFVVWIALVDLFSREIANQYARQLGAVIDTLAANLERGAQGWRLASEPADPRYFVPGSGHYWQVSAPGGQTLRSRSLWDTTLDPAAGKSTQHASLRELEGANHPGVIARTESLTVGDGADAPRVSVTAAAPIAEFRQSIDAFSRRLGAMLAVIGMALAAASALQVWFGLAPLTALRKELARVRSGEAERMIDSGPAETRMLVSELNELLDHRDRSIDKARGRAADLAHALKTPLTLLAQLVDEPRSRGAAQGMRQQIEAIRARIDRQLALARMSANRAAATDVRSVVGKLKKVMERIDPERPLVWATELPAGLRASADPVDFGEAAGNVLDNARKWAKSRVRVRASLKMAEVILEVDDDGAGVPESAHGQILMRGGRLDTNAPGSGLGLSIAGEIIEAHGGRIEFEKSPLGGLKVRLAWPEAK